MLQQTQVDRVLPKLTHEWLDEVSVARGARRPRRARRRPRRGIRSATTSARGGCRRSRASRSRATAAQLPSRRGDAAVVQGHRRVHGRRDPQLRVPASARRFSTPTSRACCSGVFVGSGDPKSHAMKRHLWSVSEALVPPRARVRLQPGADGSRRDGLRRAKPQVPRLPDGEELSAVPLRSDHAKPRTSAAPPRHDDDRRRGGRHRARRSLSRHAGGQQGVHLEGYWEFPGGKCDAGETLAACLARELREELDVDVAIGEEIFATTHAYPGDAWSCTSCDASCWALRRRRWGGRCGGWRATSSRRSEIFRPRTRS